MVSRERIIFLCHEQLLEAMLRCGVVDRKG
jgi:hypothetical protein